jgi:hypothetical protein
MNREYALFSAAVVIVAGFAFIGSYTSGTKQPSTGARCGFSPEVVAVAELVHNLPEFIQLEDGTNYTLVSAYQESNGGTAFINGTPMPNGAVSYATTIYYPAAWFFWFMPLPTYCNGGGSRVGAPFIRATVNLNPDGGFNLTSVGFYHSIFYPNGTS